MKTETTTVAIWQGSIRTLLSGPVGISLNVSMCLDHADRWIADVGASLTLALNARLRLVHARKRPSASSRRRASSLRLLRTERQRSLADRAGG